MKQALSIPVGTKGETIIEVGREMTVAFYADDMPEVYGTPIMIYHMEVTAAHSIEPYLPEGWVSVGVVVNVKHLAATPVGAKVTVRSEVIAVDGYTVTFSVEAHDGFEKIGEGTHVRACVEMARFMKKMAAKAQQG